MATDYKAVSDQELSLLLNKQDKLAFEETYHRYWLPVYQHARRMLKDEDQAADVVQDVFSAMLENLGKLNFHSSLPAYLFQASKNRIVNLFQHEKVRQGHVDSLRSYLQTNPEPADRRLREQEFAAIIQREIDALPPKMRKVFEMSKRSYLSNLEIAGQLNISETTVKKHLAVAKQKLKSRLTCFFLLQLMAFLLWINK